MIPLNIGQQDVISAIDHIRKNGVPKGRGSTRFQLVVDGEAFPPKYTVSLANKYANGEELAPARFNGGKETNSFLENLGFKIEQISPQKQYRKSKSINNTASRQVRVASDPVAQKQALLNLLERHFGVVETESKFDWLVVPDQNSMDDVLIKIVNALTSYCGYRNFFSPEVNLYVDYFIPSRSLIIEYDERQHFTIPRKIALSNYPSDLRLGFDKSAWISACETTRATDRDPEYRDEQRAFYDCLRDIMGIRNGMTVMRIKHGNYDWTGASAERQLDILLVQALEVNSNTIQCECESSADDVPSLGIPMDRVTRIVTVCVQGGSAKSVDSNAKRGKLLKEAVDAIVQHGWTNLDAVVLPGGFFYLDRSIGHLSFDSRVEAISQTSFHQTCIQACNAMTTLSPGTFIVAGVDSQSDHLCIAWSVRGIEGIGRKIFPAPREECLWYVCYKDDYNTCKRVIVLPSGRSAILCACYDVFGCAETAERPTSRTSSIHNINNQKTRYERSVFKEFRRTCINDFHNLLVNHKVAVGLGAIHNFRKPGRDNFWQRYGIQACSAALGSGLAVGAAHFLERLPGISKSTLAAANFPETYLSDKPFNERKVNEFLPKDGFYAASETVLIRLFEF